MSYKKRRGHGDTPVVEMPQPRSDNSCGHAFLMRCVMDAICSGLILRLRRMPKIAVFANISSAPATFAHASPVNSRNVVPTEVSHALSMFLTFFWPSPAPMFLGLQINTSKIPSSSGAAMLYFPCMTYSPSRSIIAVRDILPPKAANNSSLVMAHHKHRDVTR